MPERQVSLRASVSREPAADAELGGDPSAALGAVPSFKGSHDKQIVVSRGQRGLLIRAAIVLVLGAAIAAPLFV